MQCFCTAQKLCSIFSLHFPRCKKCRWRLAANHPGQSICILGAGRNANRSFGRHFSGTGKLSGSAFSGALASTCKLLSVQVSLLGSFVSAPVRDICILMAGGNANSLHRREICQTIHLHFGSWQECK